MFYGLQGDWIDGTFFAILKMMDGVFNWFLTQTRIIGAVCFAMALIMSTIKLSLGMMEINKVFLQTLMAVMLYFLIIRFYSPLMSGLQRVICGWAHDSVLSNGTVQSSIRYPSGASDAGFSEYLSKAMTGSSVPSYSISNIKITASSNNIISINACISLMIGTFKGIFMSVFERDFGDGTITTIINFFKAIPDFFMCILFGIMFLIFFSKAVVTYVGVVIEFVFFYAIGVIYVPMILWEGTKQNFATFLGGVTKISLRLLLTQMSMYFCIRIAVDIMRNMYIVSTFFPAGKEPEPMKSLEFYASSFFLMMFCSMIVENAPNIAGFLGGGEPSLGFGAVAQAARSTTSIAKGTAGAIGGVAKLGMAGAGAALKMGAGVVGGVASGIGSAVNTTKANLDAKAGVGSSLARGLGAGLSSAGKSLGNGALSVGKSAVDAFKPGGAVQNLGKSLSKATNNFKEGMGLSGGESGKGGGGGGGSGKEKKKQTAEEKLNSRSASDRLAGMGHSFVNNLKGGKGLVNSVKDSVNSYKEANAKRVGGSSIASHELKRDQAAKAQGLHRARKADGSYDLNKNNTYKYKDDKGHYKNVNGYNTTRKPKKK